jgi:hypothetical protein
MGIRKGHNYTKGSSKMKPMTTVPKKRSNNSKKSKEEKAIKKIADYLKSKLTPTKKEKTKQHNNIHILTTKASKV